jgi:hypothetical protein
MCGNNVWNGQFLGSRNARPLIFKTHNQFRMIIDRWGKVGIGTTPPDGAVDAFRLFVEDGIVTREVLVKTGPWPDHVFEKDYDLMSMEQFREYIQREKHLPGIPSAAEVEERNGIELGDMQARLLKVVEEQALYILQLKDEQDLLRQEMEVLRKEIRK